jgi:hypothetical protein
MAEAAYRHQLSSGICWRSSHWRSRMAPDGWLCGDDHEPNYPGVEQACRECFGEDYEVIGTSWRKVL